MAKAVGYCQGSDMDAVAPTRAEMVSMVGRGCRAARIVFGQAGKAELRLGSNFDSVTI